MKNMQYKNIMKFCLMVAVFVSLNSVAFCKPCTQYSIIFDSSVLTEIKDHPNDPQYMVIKYQDCNAMDQKIVIEKEGPYPLSAKPGTDIRIGNTYGGLDVAEIIVSETFGDAVPINLYCLWTIHDTPSMQCRVRPPVAPIKPPALPIHKQHHGKRTEKY